jgi:hypothetical protein
MRASLAVLAVFIACAPQLAPRVIGAAPVRAPTPVAASFDRTLDAVVEALAEQNVHLRVLDWSSGWVATEVLRVPDNSEAVTWADCGTARTDTNVVAIPPEQVEYDVVVHGDTTSSTVHVTTRWGTQYTGTWAAVPTSVECVSHGVWERHFEADVKRRAESP